jgi:hypothetical protein
MSDTANTGNLASAPLSGEGEFDARLKRADEARWLATRYAHAEGRKRLVALYLLHLELARALQAKEPMLGKIRIQWWRETIDQIAAHLTGKGAVRRHDLSEELARVLAGRADLIAPIHELVDRFDDIIDDHLQAGGHQQNDDHEAQHLAAEAALTRLAGLALDSAATPGQLDALTRLGEAHLANLADMPDTHDRWVIARVASRELPSQVWPAIVHGVAFGPHGAGRSPFSKRWRIFLAMLTRKL